MTAVTYHGEFPLEQETAEGEAYVDQFGYRFTKDKSVNVTDKAALEKLSQNRFFKVSGESAKDDVEQGKDEAEKAEADTLRAFLADNGVPVHHKAGLTKLRELKADYDKKAAAAAQD